MNFENMNPDAVAAYNRLIEAWGSPLTVTSAYRSPEYNAQVGGAKGSQHLHGNALDFDVANMSLEDRLRLIDLARQQGFQGIGVYDNSLHFDVGNPRMWGPDYTSASVPAWAQGNKPPQNVGGLLSTALNPPAQDQKEGILAKLAAAYEKADFPSFEVPQGPQITPIQSTPYMAPQRDNLAPYLQFFGGLNG